MQSGGTPLVERIEGGDEVLATFLLRIGIELENATVFASVLPDNDPVRTRLRRLPGTDVWVRCYRFRRDVPMRFELSDDGPRKLRSDSLPATLVVSRDDGPGLKWHLRMTPWSIFEDEIERFPLQVVPANLELHQKRLIGR